MVPGAALNHICTVGEVAICTSEEQGGPCEVELRKEHKVWIGEVCNALLVVNVTQYCIIMLESVRQSTIYACVHKLKVCHVFIFAGRQNW